MSYKNFLNSVGRELADRRKELGLTQSDLVEIINQGISKNDDDYISEKILSRVEQGKCFTRIDKFKKWALALDKTPDYFLLRVEHGSDSIEGKIQQITACLRNCNESDVDLILMIAQIMCQRN